MTFAATPPVAEHHTSGLGRVAWTRGLGCLPLAERLDDGPAIAISGDLQRSCVTDRIDLLVARRFTSFDLVPTVVPHGIELDEVTAVTAAVGDGPHSPLAAAVVARLASSLGVPGELATVYRTDEELPAAKQRLDRLARRHPSLERRASHEVSAVRLINTLTPSTLLVVGAPGGSWFQRQIYGPGHRLLVAAPAGAVVVRSAPRRCYQDALDPTGVAIGPHLAIADAQRVVTHTAGPVAVAGELVGILRATAIHQAPRDATVADVMESPVAVTSAEPLEAAHELAHYLDYGPVPVVDHTGRLVGIIHHGPQSATADPHSIP